jgi:deoxyadenosine/deoxycytidine kinase
MVIITIDGGIGSGKSSVLNYLHKYYKLAIDLEPVEKWQSFLEDFYENKNNIFNFQVRVWLDRCWIQEKSEKSLILMERSPFFTRNVFIKSVYNKKLITDNEYYMINDLYDKTNSIWCPNAYIYLRSNPENCLDRIKKRGRTCEKNIDTDYTEYLHELHENAYKEALQNNMNVICIDVENKTVAQIAAEIYNLDIIQNEL